MALDAVLKELAKLSPEEQKSLKALFGGTPAEEKKKNPPAAPIAQTVYFFEQMERLQVTREWVDKDKLKKEATVLPPRVIAVDEKMAAKLFWKQSRKYKYLGRSNGKAWSRSRGEGKSVSESQMEEFKVMMADPDMTPPPNKEKTFFRGTKLAQLERAQEIGWNEGIKQGIRS